MRELDQFFETVFPNLKNQLIEIRVFGDSRPTEQLFFESVKKLMTFLPKIKKERPRANVYFGVCPRSERKGNKDAITRAWCLWADVDWKDFRGERKEAWQVVRDFPIRPTVILRSGHGYHLYWRLKKSVELRDPESVAHFESLLKAVARGVHGDPAAAELARVLRVPGTVNWKRSPAVRVDIALLKPDREYTLAEFESLLATQTAPRGETFSDVRGRNTEDLYQGVLAGQRNSALTRFAGLWLREGVSQADALTLGMAVNSRNRPPLDESEVIAVIKGVYRRYAGTHSKAKADAPWPQLPAEALYGLPGEIVKFVSPETESDPAAVLVQILLLFGNIIGHGPHFVAESTNHPLNLFCVLVGETGRGRKGTAWGLCKKMFAGIDDSYFENRIQPGLKTGEGIVEWVRNATFKKEPVRRKGRITAYKKVMIDPGEPDKRTIFIEEEFSSVLKVMSAPHSVLSPTLRCAWDSGNLGIVTRTSRVKATGAHISLIGHITREELRVRLNSTEIANGFANRFLWLCVRRANVLPRGGFLEDEQFQQISSLLRCAREEAIHVGEMNRDEDAEKLWDAVYRALAEKLPGGLVGAILSRAEPQIMRLACIYALLDESSVVRKVHLKAAVALWQYCEDSVRHIFGSATGDPLADRILRALRTHSDGLTRTEISDVVGRNASAERIEAALGSLEGRWARVEKDTPEKGRPTERWFLA
jgi:hypothetical protein